MQHLSVSFLPLFVTFLLFAPLAAFADHGDCGQPFSDGAKPKSSDALYTLRSSVGLVACPLCQCDVSGNGKVQANDALIDLRVAVGQPAPLDCPPCDCPPQNGLDDVLFNEKYTCAEDGFCVDLNAGDQFRFTHKGDGNYEARDVPDTGFVYVGKLDCTTFAWTATGHGYTETGTWEFNAALTAFSGSSSYEADDHSYAGDCNGTGAEAPAVPPNPTPVPGCF